MKVPGGLTADVFQRVLDALLPAGPPTRRAVLAGPGRPSPDAGVDILRDDPLPPRPNYLFRADRGTFQHTLVRLPAVRSPWLRTILENLTQGTSADLF